MNHLSHFYKIQSNSTNDMLQHQSNIILCVLETLVDTDNLDNEMISVVSSVEELNNFFLNNYQGDFQNYRAITAPSAGQSRSHQTRQKDDKEVRNK